RVHVGAVALEALVLGHVDVDVEVAGLAAARRGFALAGQAQALPVVDPGWDADRQRLRLLGHARAAAVLALVADECALAAAARARRADHEEALLVQDLAAAAARRAALGLGAGLGARAAARRARDVARDLDLAGHAAHRLGEGELHGDAQVVAARPATAAE